MKYNKKNLITRRQFIRYGAYSAAGMTAFGSLTSCFKGSSSNVKNDLLTSAYIPIHDCVPLIVAYEKGFFRELGVEAARPKLVRSWPALLEAFTSKQILLTHILLPQVIFMRFSRGIKLRSVAFNHTDTVSILRSNSLLSNQELGGKIVGCPTWWAPHTGIFQDFVRALGFTPVAGVRQSELKGDQVGFRVMPPPDMIDALRTGAIAACTVSEPFGAGAELLADATLIKMSGDVWPKHPCCQSVMLEETINRDREWSAAITIALYKAAKWSRENRSELATILSKEGGGYFPMPEKVIKRSLLYHDLDHYGSDGSGAIMHPEWDVKRVDFIPWPSKFMIHQTLELMGRMVVDKNVALPENLKRLTGDEVAGEVVDYELAKKGLNAVGGFSAFGMDQNYGKDVPYEMLIKKEKDVTA